MHSARLLLAAAATPQPAGRRGTKALASYARAQGCWSMPAGRQCSRAGRAVCVHAGTSTVPSAADLEIWKSAQAVCFDVDCTILNNDSLDLLAEFMHVGDAVAELTSAAMDGSMNLEEALDRRLRILNCTPDDLRAFTAAHPPTSRLEPFAADLVAALHKRDVEVYLISGGFRELILPLAKLLGIPPRNVLANRMTWQFDDDTGLPSKLVGFDLSQATAHNRGKPEAIRELRRQHPYQNVVMIGDGITDLEAVQETGAADLFIGYGGAVERAAVRDAAAWYVYSHKDLLACVKQYNVALIGSGAWACAAGRMVAQNCRDEDPGQKFARTVRMWVYEEDVAGTPLSEVINGSHENVKYFPGIALPENLVACPNIADVVEDADVIVFCVPHQFVRGICQELKGRVKESAIAVSLTKGMRVRKDGPQLVSQMIASYLRIDTCVLMGANIAADIGREELSEATIGYTSLDNALLLQQLFQRPYFHVALVPDVAGAEMAGTLKNIVALACGFVDGLGLGPNTKAAVMREGLKEMRAFAQALYPSVRDETFLESCGVADLIATCYGGRNRRVAERWARLQLAGTPDTFAALERTLLGGQKLQGVLTSDEVQEVLEQRGWELQYPLFTTVNLIVQNQVPVTELTNYLEVPGRMCARGQGVDDPFGIAGGDVRTTRSAR